MSNFPWEGGGTLLQNSYKPYPTLSMRGYIEKENNIGYAVIVIFWYKQTHRYTVTFM